LDNLSDNNKWMSEDRKEVRISDAFAHLAIAEHGTVAIATNRHSSHLTSEGPTNLGIIACANLPPGVSEGSKKPNESLAKNARYDDPLRSYPAIITPVEPGDFSKFPSLNDYMKNLEENW
jgi:hypothetical protein